MNNVQIHPSGAESRSQGWLMASLSLNFVFVQFVVLTIEEGWQPLLNGFSPIFAAGWGLLSVLLAGLLGFIITPVWNRREGQHRGVELLIGLAGIIGLISSAPPNHPWFGIHALTLVQYPLAGLELKSIAILLAVVAMYLKGVPLGQSIEGLEQDGAKRRTTRVGLIAMASMAAALAIAITIPILSTGSSVFTAPATVQSETGAVSILPEDGYELPASYQTIGPALLEAGAIDLDRMVSHFNANNEPLSSDQISILTKGSAAPIVIDRHNARFLLDFFWAFGLANHNPVLVEGPMQSAAEGEIGRFASTGGWTLGAKSGAELYASQRIVELSGEQQALVENIASKLYRPCCNNPTSFPDCNHGMAMLGMLELMAAQGASESEMWQAAKYVNAYWFTPQMTEVAIAFDVAKDVGFEDMEGEEALGSALFSASGYRNLHTFLQSKGLLQGESTSGASCGV